MHFTDSLKSQLDLLPSLHALLEEKHVSRAADRMGVSQPAMSRTLAQLRDALGDRLIERSGSGMMLTPRAEALIPAVRNLLNDAHKLFATTSFNPAETEQDFRIALPDPLSHYILPRLASAFRTAAPNASWHAHDLPDLNANQYTDDLNLILTPNPGPLQNWQTQRLYSDHYVLAHAAPIDKKADLLSLPHIAIIPPGTRRDPADDWLEAGGYERLISVSVPSFSLAAELIGATDSVAILPRRFAAYLAETRGVLWTDAWPDQSPQPVWLAYPRRLEQDPASIWMRNLTTSILRSL